jgi:hypothetical protein
MHSAIIPTGSAVVNQNSFLQFLPSDVLGQRGVENPAFDQFGYTKSKEVIVSHFPDGVECFIDLGKASYGDISTDNVAFCLGEVGIRGVRGEGDHARSAVASARRAKTQVRRKSKMIRADCMITLTYRENVTDEARVQADFKAFRKRLAKLGKFHYVACLETQQRGALHVHIACQSFPAFLMQDGVRVKSFNLLRAMWHRVVGRGNGACNVSKPRGRNSSHRIASYLAKYVAKGIEDGVFNKKSYWSSTGIPKPLVTRFLLPGSVSEFDAITDLYRGWVAQGYTEVTQHYDRLNGFYWFAASRP